MVARLARPGRTALAVATGALLAATAAGAQEVHQPGCMRLDGLAEGHPGAGLPPGWSLRGVSGERPPTATVVEVDGSLALSLEADSAAGQIWRELPQPVQPGAGSLEWAWRVDLAPTGVDLEVPELDDSPARVFVVFGGGGLFGRPRTLFYTWGDQEGVGHSFLSHVSDRVGVVVLRNRDDAVGTWHGERRDIFQDFRNAFGREPEEVRAVGFMADTDQTGEAARSFLRSVWWRGEGGVACGASGQRDGDQADRQGPQQRRVDGLVHPMASRHVYAPPAARAPSLRARPSQF